MEPSGVGENDRNHSKTKHIYWASALLYWPFVLVEATAFTLLNMTAVPLCRCLCAPFAERISLSFWNPNSLHYVIDWSAWATLVVGIAAVVGAVLIGQMQAAISLKQAEIAERQAHIMERQTGIAEQQAETERTRLRAELYDRRVVVFAGIEQYLADSSSCDGVVSNEVRDGLFKSLAVATFLMGSDVDRLGKEPHGHT